LGARHALSKGDFKSNPSHEINDFKVVTMVLKLILSSVTKYKTLEVNEKDSNNTFNYFAKPFLVVSLASKRFTIT
jgi:hypothetical protein